MLLLGVVEVFPVGKCFTRVLILWILLNLGELLLWNASLVGVVGFRMYFLYACVVNWVCVFCSMCGCCCIVTSSTFIYVILGFVVC